MESRLLRLFKTQFVGSEETTHTGQRSENAIVQYGEDERGHEATEKVSEVLPSLYDGSAQKGHWQRKQYEDTWNVECVMLEIPQHQEWQCDLY